MTETQRPVLTRNDAKLQILRSIKIRNIEKDMKRVIFKIDEASDEIAALETYKMELSEEMDQLADMYLDLNGFVDPVEESETKTEPSHAPEDVPASDMVVDVEATEVTEDGESE